MISDLSKPILSANGAVASIKPAEIAPDIPPKVNTVFFMEVLSPFENSCHLRRNSGSGRAELSSSFRMILRVGGQNHAFGRRSRDQAGFFAKLDGLGASFCAQFVEHPAGMRLYRALADKQALSDF